MAHSIATLISDRKKSGAEEVVAVYNVFCADPRVLSIGANILARISTNNKNYWTSAFGASKGILDCMARIQEAIDLAGITEINFIDHLNCAKYRAVYGEQAREKEEREHMSQLLSTVEVIQERFPTINHVGLYLLTTVEPDAISWTEGVMRLKENLAFELAY